MKRWIPCILAFVLGVVLTASYYLFFPVEEASDGSFAAVTEGELASRLDVDLHDLDAVTRMVQQDEERRSIRILGIGNSWARDDFSLLCAMLEDAGYIATVGQAYLGGSNLYHQYFGIFDENYSYSHDGVEQIVHASYQYQKYTGAGTRELYPSGVDYGNGGNGVGVTLSSILIDEPWDIIVFQQSATIAGLKTGWIDETNTDTFVDAAGKTVTLTWDINDFIRAVVGLLPAGAKTPRIGLSIPWAPADGTSDSAMTTYYKNYNNGVVPTTAEEKTAVNEIIQGSLQEMGRWAAEYSSADFVCNPGLALYNARQNRALASFGWNMQRAQDNTHLASGIPMYVTGMAIIHDALGVSYDDFRWYPSDATVSYASDDADGETVETTEEPTDAIAWLARVYGVTEQIYQAEQDDISSQWGGGETETVAAFTSQPEDAFAAVGDIAVFHVALDGDAAGFQWQYRRSDAGIWKDIDIEDYPSADTDTFAEERKASQDGNQYRCVVTLPDGKIVLSDSATLTILPSVIQAPHNYMGIEGQNAAYYIAATGAGLTYQWQVCPPTGEAWTNVNFSLNGSASAYLTFTATDEMGGYLFRCIVQDKHGTEVISSSAVLELERADDGRASMMNYFSVGSVIYRDESYPNVQGLATDRERYIYIACREGENNAFFDAQPTMLRKLDTDGHVLGSNNETCYCHANSVTYCARDGCLYISTLGRVDNVMNQNDPCDPQQFNVIGVADAETLENVGFLSVESQMQSLGNVLRTTGGEGSRYLKAAYYDPQSDQFVCLTKEYYLDSDRTIPCFGLVVFDHDWNLLGFHEFQMMEEMHLGSITGDDEYYYISDNMEATVKYMLVFDRQFRYFGKWALESGVVQEFECADFIGNHLYGSVNTNPITVQRFSVLASVPAYALDAGTALLPAD